MEAERLKTECSICHREIDGSLREHLLDHSKEDLVKQLLTLIEAIEGDGEE